MTNRPKPEPKTIAREHHIRQLAFDHHIILAYRGRTKLLRDTLLSDTPLSHEHREKLVELIYRRIERKSRGRPPGSVPVRNAAAEDTFLILREAQRLRLRRYGDKRVPRGGWKELIDQAVYNVGDELDVFRGPIDFNKIRNEVRRGKKKQ